MANFPKQQPTQEMIDDWEWFIDYVSQKIRHDIERGFVSLDTEEDVDGTYTHTFTVKGDNKNE